MAGIEKRIVYAHQQSNEGVVLIKKRGMEKEGKV
jgi:hypothetical protein